MESSFPSLERMIRCEIRTHAYYQGRWQSCYFKFVFYFPHLSFSLSIQQSSRQLHERQEAESSFFKKKKIFFNSLNHGR